MKKRVLAFAVLLIAAFMLCGTAMAAGEKFIRVYRDNSYDMYVNRASIIQNQGMISSGSKAYIQIQVRLW